MKDGGVVSCSAAGGDQRQSTHGGHCGRCGRLFVFLEEFESHQETCGDDDAAVGGGRVGDFVCGVCGVRRYPYLHVMRNHERTCAAEKASSKVMNGDKASAGGKLTNGDKASSYASGKLTNGDASSYTCAVCGLAFQHLETLKTHQETCGNSSNGNRSSPEVGAGDSDDAAIGTFGNFVCGVCGVRRFPYLHVMRNHEWKCAGKTNGAKASSYTCAVKTNGDKASSYTCAEKTNGDDKTYACGVCGRTYQYLENLQNHERTCTATETNGDEKTYTCGVCGRSFLFLENFEKHERQCTKEANGDGNNKTYACSVCSRTFLYPESLEQHERQCTIAKDPKTYACGTCGRGYQLLENLQKHELNCGKPAKEGDFTCGACSRVFPFEHLLQSHSCGVDDQNSSSSSPPVFGDFACGVCDRRFPYEPVMKSHEWICSGEKYMDEQSPNSSPEQDHPPKPKSPSSEASSASTTVGGGKSFPCSICHRTFKYKHVLQNHERTHTGEKPFECPECHKRFTRDHHLKTHMRLHTGEKPYQCNHCNRHFVQVANLRRHLRVHTGERPYACQMCESRFSDSNQLKAHMLIHKGEKPYQCPKCLGRFRRRHHLIHHKCPKDESNAGRPRRGRRPKAYEKVTSDHEDDPEEEPISDNEENIVDNHTSSSEADQPSPEPIVNNNNTLTPSHDPLTVVINGHHRRKPSRTIRILTPQQRELFLKDKVSMQTQAIDMSLSPSEVQRTAKRFLSSVDGVLDLSSSRSDSEVEVDDHPPDCQCHHHYRDDRRPLSRRIADQRSKILEIASMIQTPSRLVNGVKHLSEDSGAIPLMTKKAHIATA